MCVQWYNYIFRERHDTHIQIVDIRARTHYGNPIDLGQDLAPEDGLLENSIAVVFRDLNSEACESCQFNPDCLEVDRLKQIVKNHGKTLF